jgi:hypothetical protein
MKADGLILEATCVSDSRVAIPGHPYVGSVVAGACAQIAKQLSV